MIGNSIFKSLYEIQKFIESYPSEFIILKFQQDKSPLNKILKKFFVKRLLEIFKEKMINGNDYHEWFKIPSVTMGEIRENKKNIMIVFRNEIFKNYTEIEDPKEGIKIN